MPDSIRAEFSDLVANLDGAGDWEATVAAFGEYVAEGFDLDPWAEIASRIERCIEEGRPASFIRIGDGEGNLLALELDEYPELADHCASLASRVHFGSTDVLVPAASELLPAFQTALRNSDLIGFPGPFGGGILLDRESAEIYVRPIQGLASTHRYLIRLAAELELGSKTGAPAGFHRGLLPHYEGMVSGRRIGIVTCHPELAEGLRARMGAKTVDLRLVPRQAAATGQPGSDTGHWPDRFRVVVRELESIEPGSLWFVAAGLLGKLYCDAIRAAGGIAVDIGHAADIWAGFRSRASIPPRTIAEWRLVPDAGEPDAAEPNTGSRPRGGRTSASP